MILGGDRAIRIIVMELGRFMRVSWRGSQLATYHNYNRLPVCATGSQ